MLHQEKFAAKIQEKYGVTGPSGLATTKSLLYKTQALSGLTIGGPTSLAQIGRNQL
jgi:hypothetical protein